MCTWHLATFKMRSVHECQQMAPFKLSSLQQYRVNLLLYALVIIQFLNIFGQLADVSSIFESLNLSQIFNYTALLGCAYLFLRQKANFSVQLLVSLAILLAMLIMNYLLAPLASLKWFFNWLGFIFVSLMIVQIVKSITDAEMQSLQTKSLTLVKLILIFLASLVAFAWLTNISDFVMNFLSNDTSQTISILSKNLGIEKQALGTLLMFLALLALMHWSILPKSTRILFFITLLIILPAMLGIRTLWLGLFLSAVWVYFTKYHSRMVFVCVSIPIALVIFLVYQFEVMIFVSEIYDRLPSLQFAWSAMTSNLFGLGNGGYHGFVQANNDTINAMFGSERMLEYGLFWAAPESDLVYFIASWGIFSVFFFVFFGYILVRGGRVFHRKIGLLPIERLMLLMAGAMIFMGVSQDNAGMLTWWVYLAAGFGVILRHRGSGQKGNQTTLEFEKRTNQLVRL